MTILDEAKALIGGDRQDAYGDAKDNFARIAAIWAVILGAPVTGRQVALCMIGTKIARDVHSPRRDNLTDICGYAALADALD